MKTHQRITAIALLTVAGLSQAGFDEGVAAFDRGDYRAAMAEWRPLAEQGDARAQSNLGRMYADGQGVAQDDRQALHWYRLAAEQGLADAQFNLGVMYDNGLGVAQDDAEAYAWFAVAVAAANGAAGAAEHRDRIAKRLTPAQRAAGQTLARRYFEQYAPQ